MTADMIISLCLLAAQRRLQNAHLRCLGWRDWIEEVNNKMYAVIETGGKQYRVQEGDVISVEKLDVTAGDKVALEKVLVLSDGKIVKVGTPYVKAAKVMTTVVENGKGEKVIIFKYKSKKDYRKKQGHRQPYTMLKIESLGEKAPKAADKVEMAEAEIAKKPVAEKKPAAKKTAHTVEEKK